jgi:Flp pilus assembly pilin Flp
MREGNPERRTTMLKNMLRKVIRDESAQDLAEYGIALAVIGALTAAVVLALGSNVVSLWSAASSVVAFAV